MENKKTERILVINPGSTSTKIAVFDDDKQIMAQTIRHPLDEVKAFSWVMDQFDYRMEHINAALGLRESTSPPSPALWRAAVCCLPYLPVHSMSTRI